MISNWIGHAMPKCSVLNTCAIKRTLPVRNSIKRKSKKNPRNRRSHFPQEASHKESWQGWLGPMDSPPSFLETCTGLSVDLQQASALDSRGAQLASKNWIIATQITTQNQVQQQEWNDLLSTQ